MSTDPPDEEALSIEAPGLWQLREMYFDGASQREPGSGRDAPKTRAGAGVVFLTPEKGAQHYSFTLLKLKENC